MRARFDIGLVHYKCRRVGKFEQEVGFGGINSDLEGMFVDHFETGDAGGLAGCHLTHTHDVTQIGENGI